MKFLRVIEETVVVLGSINPLDIAVNAEGGETTIHTDGEQSLVDILQLPNLYALLKRDSLIWATIIIICLLISMYFIKKSEKLAERKADIMHKFLIVFIICSLLWILDVAVFVLDSIF